MPPGRNVPQKLWMEACMDHAASWFPLPPAPPTLQDFLMALCTFPSNSAFSPLQASLDFHSLPPCSIQHSPPVPSRNTLSVVSAAPVDFPPTSLATLTPFLWLPLPLWMTCKY